jgi:hypothetical protein
VNGAFATFPIGIAASILLWPPGRTAGAGLVPRRAPIRQEPRFGSRYNARIDPRFDPPPGGPS